VKNLTWQNPEQLFVAQELINKVKSKCCGIKDVIQTELEQLLGCRVDLVRVRENMNSLLKQRIQQEALYV
jgi:predicted nucleotidyltransferase